MVIFFQENVFYFVLNNEMNYLVYKYWRFVKIIIDFILRVILKDVVLLRYGNKSVIRLQFLEVILRYNFCYDCFGVYF